MKKGFHLMSLLFALTFCFAFHSAKAQHAPHKVIRGQVIDSITQKPIADAIILFRDGDLTKIAKTDKNGNFKIRLPHTHFWEMKISIPGYQEYSCVAVNGMTYKGPLLIKLKPNS